MIEIDFIQEWEIHQWAKSFNENDKLLTQLIISLEKDEPTNDLVEIFKVMSKDIADRYPYHHQSYKEDMIQHGILSALINWKRFNYKHPRNDAQLYFIQIIKNGHAQCLRNYSQKTKTTC